MPPGHHGCDSVGYAAQCGHTGGDWRAASQRATETSVVGHLQRMPEHRSQKHLIWCRLIGKKRRLGGTYLQWVDVIDQKRVD